ncbi:hypothetical protein LTR56_004314 [Elasticomyces elasticus]|nr:hypothetical protein LTR22_012042 [Elasticomyces elasticus]KAK3653902.1 hypothetical protein LTR56_004314 [Elasticomyces elasticus]KAK4919302.1 hypothetical protein LTR49_013000 [Elasticomyces elasticus]KAK5748722.1 hypothetical protein LTS12_021233 [Elasticomyces elasticus]
MCKTLQIVHFCNHAVNFNLSSCLGAYATKPTAWTRSRKHCRQSPYLRIRHRTACGDCIQRNTELEGDRLRQQALSEVEAIQKHLDDPDTDWRLIEQYADERKVASRNVEAVEKLNRRVMSEAKRAFPGTSTLVVNRREVTHRRRVRGSLLHYEVTAEALQADFKKNKTQRHEATLNDLLIPEMCDGKAPRTLEEVFQMYVAKTNSARCPPFHKKYDEKVPRTLGEILRVNPVSKERIDRMRSAEKRRRLASEEPMEGVQNGKCDYSWSERVSPCDGFAASVLGRWTFGKSMFASEVEDTEVLPPNELSTIAYGSGLPAVKKMLEDRPANDREDVVMSGT